MPQWYFWWCYVWKSETLIIWTRRFALKMDLRLPSNASSNHEMNLLFSWWPHRILTTYTTGSPCLTCLLSIWHIYCLHIQISTLHTLNLDNCTVQYILYTIYIYITLKFTPQIIQLKHIFMNIAKPSLFRTWSSFLTGIY